MKRLSKRANQVLQMARAAAREYGQSYVGTEHLLLGIIREGTSLAARTLLDHGANEDRAKSAIDQRLNRHMEKTWVTGRVPGSPHFMNVFGRAERIADRLGQPHICVEHLLAALLTKTGSVGNEALRTMGISMELVDNAFHEQLPACSPEGSSIYQQRYSDAISDQVSIAESIVES